MSASIIPQLVRKDLLIWRRLIVIFYGLSLAFAVITRMLIGVIPNHVLLNFGFTLLIAPVGTLGIVLLMQTNVFEKAKSTQPFIMSLPVTTRDFTVAKLLVNIPVFSVLWLVTSAAIFWFAFGFGVLPHGAIPVVAMICLGVFVAYTGILSVSLLTQSLGVTILAILFCEVGTSAYLWLVVYLEPISRHVFDPVAVWNSTAVGIVTAQVVAGIAAIAATLMVQTRRRDFV